MFLNIYIKKKPIVPFVTALNIPLVPKIISKKAIQNFTYIKNKGNPLPKKAIFVKSQLRGSLLFSILLLQHLQKVTEQSGELFSTPIIEASYIYFLGKLLFYNVYSVFFCHIEICWYLIRVVRGI